MKEFILNQTRSALGRLRRSVVMILKIVFIVFVNAVLWLLPLFFMGWLSLDWILSAAGDHSSVRSTPGSQYQAPFRERSSTPGLDWRNLLQSAEYFMREIQFWKR